jgi:hypothetical protein
MSSCLPSALKSEENGVVPGLAVREFMLLPSKLVRMIALFVFVTAFAWAQSGDFANLLRKAQAGDPKAQLDLAKAYSDGTEVPKDSAKSLEWLRKSAAQGYAGAEVVLGLFYQKGVLGIEKDPSEAAKWYKKAARQAAKDPKHSQTAQGHLSEMLAEGSISAKEADWHTPESGATTTRQVKTTGAPPFSLGDVETGLTGGITTKRMATLVTTYGVDFTLSGNSKKRLTDDGADDTLLQTIASSKR